MTEYKRKTPDRMGQIESNSTDGSRHMLRWAEWGEAANPRVLFCAHGLSRNGRDFDYLASAAAADYRVICPDYPGRGKSDQLVDPRNYHNQQYLLDTLHILSSLTFEQLDWVGTSMGGLIGIGLASMKEHRVRRMVINDVGAFIPGEALALINQYLSVHPKFESLDQAENYFRSVYASFGPLEDEHYHHLVQHGIMQAEDDAGYVLNHDPAMIDQFISLECKDIELWDLWDKVNIPTLIIRGEKSGLLLRSTIEQMKLRHKGADSEEIAHCAHAPSLMVPDQIKLVLDWLQS
ncbi:MAG: alpha/beta fold hydrolase [bacterium]